ncbi:hypothetical protein [uncultured Aquimarina sp.]|uniref:hypothetical protein n=1 Tax=uncultured Aquimarina sp. TaxID=575652 RepID=UPI00262553EA|nr:hypothetical protein [uncultured Aquimarina sp.]
MKALNIIYFKFYILFLPLLFLSFNSIELMHSPLQQQSMYLKSKIKKQFFYLEVFGKGSDVEIRLNDIPVCKLKTDSTPTGYGNSSSNVQYYIIPGINTLSIYPLTKKGETTIRLVQFSKGDNTNNESNEETLVEIENDDTPIHKKVEFSSNIKRWSWMDTDSITDKKVRKKQLPSLNHSIK